MTSEMFYYLLCFTIFAVSFPLFGTTEKEKEREWNHFVFLYFDVSTRDIWFHFRIIFILSFLLAFVVFVIDPLVKRSVFIFWPRKSIVTRQKLKMEMCTCLIHLTLGTKLTHESKKRKINENQKFKFRLFSFFFLFLTRK